MLFNVNSVEYRSKKREKGKGTVKPESHHFCLRKFQKCQIICGILCLNFKFI